MATVKSKAQTKSDLVKQLLARAKGATLDELCQSTDWQPHSVRAFLTGLRKKSFTLAKEQRGETETAYRISASPPKQTDNSSETAN